MVRGNNKQRIFIHKDDYLGCYDILARIVSQYHCKVHLFCLMGNHMHLLIETGHIPLKRIMQSLLSNFTKSFNKKYNRVGHLFQGRYHAKNVVTDPYFFELIYYIHNNPVKANMVEDMNNYPWSSHNYYQENFSSLEWLTTEYLIEKLLLKYESYAEFLLQYDIGNKAPQFCTVDEDHLLIIVSDTESSKEKDLFNLSSLKFGEVCDVVCDSVGVDHSTLSSASLSRTVCRARGLACFFAHFYAKYPINYISVKFETGSESLSRLMYRHINSDANTDLIKTIKVELLKLIEDKKFS